MTQLQQATDGEILSAIRAGSVALAKDTVHTDATYTERFMALTDEAQKRNLIGWSY